MSRDRLPTRRILIALDAFAPGSGTLESVVDLAARLEAELFGLFVEDLNLLHSAALPFVRQFNLLTAGEESFEPIATERQLRLKALEAWQRLADAAHERHVKLEFRVVRGLVEREVSNAATEADVLVVQGPTGPLARHLHLAQPTGVAAGRIRKSFVLMGPTRWSDRPVMAVYDGSDESGRGLELATRLAGAKGQRLDVILVDRTGSPLELERGAMATLAGKEVHTRFTTVPAADVTRLTTLAADVRPGLVVIAAACPCLAEVEIQALPNELGCTVFLVR